MDLRYTAEQEAFRQEIRDFLEKNKEICERAMHEEEEGSMGDDTKKVRRLLGAKGYLTPQWPKEWGGLGRTNTDKYIVDEELAYAIGTGAHGAAEGMAGPVILGSGSEQQKKEFLPRIARGEIEFALGYSEPEAGSDLVNLQMRAIRDGDHYVVNGQKVFNTACHYAEYHWLAVRTNTNVPKHKGISMMIVDMDSPGITVRPMWGMAGVRTNEVFYDDVKVPVSRLVGEENKGWEYLSAALAFERNWQVGYMFYQFDEFVKFCKTAKRDGKPFIEDPMVREAVAQMAIDLEVSRLFGLRCACMIEKGKVPTGEAAVAKVFGSDLWHRMFDQWMKLLSLYGQLQPDSEDSVMHSRVMQWYFLAARSTMTRGTNEVMRNMIANRSLGMPR
ncbi:MAG: acyl-CoA dehydrogenase family protein [Dehalococcoidia bacterium]|nr:acyl-CoA dehydrogenase family protein [Dehalococcoidia bacterium]